MDKEIKLSFFVHYALVWRTWSRLTKALANLFTDLLPGTIWEKGVEALRVVLCSNGLTKTSLQDHEAVFQELLFRITSTKEFLMFLSEGWFQVQTLSLTTTKRPSTVPIFQAELLWCLWRIAFLNKTMATLIQTFGLWTSLLAPGERIWDQTESFASQHTFSYAIIDQNPMFNEYKKGERRRFSCWKA